MLYANVITIMEVYLSDCFIRKIIDNKKLIPKLLEQKNAISQQKFSLSEAYDWMENLEENLIEELSNISFHNLGRVKSMYENVLNIKFKNDIGDLFRAIEKRHDIIHRNGKTKEGKELNINKQDIIKLIDLISKFIKDIENKARKI